MHIWLTIIGMGLITYSIRVSPILLLERIELSDGVRQALRFVPVAVLTAIIFPEMFQPGGQLDLTFGNERMLAGIVAIVAAYLTRNVLWTVGVGMAALWLLQMLQ